MNANYRGLRAFREITIKTGRRVKIAKRAASERVFDDGHGHEPFRDEQFHFCRFCRRDLFGLIGGFGRVSVLSFFFFPRYYSLGRGPDTS